MARLNGGQVLVEVLRRFRVDTAFTLHGGHLDSAYQAARDAGMRMVDTRHEQAAGFAAEAYARTTDRVGVVWVTAGGGITNVVSPIANANIDCVPMLVIGGAPALQDIDALPVNAGVRLRARAAGLRRDGRLAVCKRHQRRSPACPAAD